MKKAVPAELERCRVKTGELASTAEFGMNGAFMVRTGGHCYGVVASDGMGWDHVSVQVIHSHRCPTWEEMCYFKDLFWEEDEVVMQLHPAQEDWINIHPRVLHLWRSQGEKIPLPPQMMV